MGRNGGGASIFPADRARRNQGAGRRLPARAGRLTQRSTAVAAHAPCGAAGGSASRGGRGAETPSDQALPAVQQSMRAGCLGKQCGVRAELGGGGGASGHKHPKTVGTRQLPRPGAAPELQRGVSVVFLLPSSALCVPADDQSPGGARHSASRSQSRAQSARRLVIQHVISARSAPPDRPGLAHTNLSGRCAARARWSSADGRSLCMLAAGSALAPEREPGGCSRGPPPPPPRAGGSWAQAGRSRVWDPSDSPLRWLNRLPRWTGAQDRRRRRPRVPHTTGASPCRAGTAAPPRPPPAPWQRMQTPAQQTPRGWRAPRTATQHGRLRQARRAGRGCMPGWLACMHARTTQRSACARSPLQAPASRLA